MNAIANFCLVCAFLISDYPPMHKLWNGQQKASVCYICEPNCRLWLMDVCWVSMSSLSFYTTVCFHATGPRYPHGVHFTCPDRQTVPSCLAPSLGLYQTVPLEMWCFLVFNCLFVFCLDVTVIVVELRVCGFPTFSYLGWLPLSLGSSACPPSKNTTLSSSSHC